MLTHHLATDLAADRMAQAQATAARERVRRALHPRHWAHDPATADRVVAARQSGRPIPTPPPTPVRVF